MSEQSTLLLQALWSWADAIASMLLLGALLPAVIGFIVGALPLAMHRRDWRPIRQLSLVVLLVLVAGYWSFALIRPPVPERAFWLVLSLQMGVLVFMGVLIFTVRLARRRVKEDRAALSSVMTSRPDQPSLGQIAIEPAPRPRLNAFEAEYWVAEWMRFLGATESIVTPSRRDGGVDVRSDHYVAQVKHRPGDLVSVDGIRALAGVANVEERTPLFFSSSPYSRDAIAFASSAGMALFIFRPAEGRLVGANATASRLRNHGLLGRTAPGSGLAELPVPVRA